MSDKKNQSYRNLYLIGFMGVGKSHFARLVAKELECDFIDSDQEISKQEQCSIPEIFEKYGESYFRDLERTFVESVHPEGACVIACGGGLAVQEGMMELLKSKGFVVALFASEESIIGRTGKNKNRPLLNVENPEDRIKRLLDVRTPIYLQSDLSISTEGRTETEVTQSIIRAYKKHLRFWEQ